ncbi:Aromatic amino acid transport protein [Geobacillus proteiniphilus]|uniref:Aromatic amino acid transport protein n=1 Tax=Geobacillus proteiniphilus TaxID=860353 RepID=A0A1Q5T025_9BACL|nr:Aromatic amino acid transport protein [Geobacillus proteiniphilus]
MKKYIDETKPFFQTKGFPYTTIVAVVSLGAIWIEFLFENEHRFGSILCLAILSVLAMYTAIKEKQRRRLETKAPGRTA